MYISAFNFVLKYTMKFLNILLLYLFSRFLYLPSIPTYSETVAKIFCLFVWSGQIAFQMGYISIFTCVSLTIERWIAVVKPNTYRSLKRKHALATVLVIWISGVAVNASTFFRIKYLPSEHACKWAPYPFAKDEFPWIDLTVQTIIPDITMVVLYAHIYFRMKNLPQMSSNRNSQIKKITVVALLTCSALILGWLPARISFMLSKYGYGNPSSTLHGTFLLLAFSNSCVNPWLYGMYNSMFRTEYKIVLQKALKLCAKIYCFSTADVSVNRHDPVNKNVSVRSLQAQSENSSFFRRGIYEQSVL